MDYYRIEFKKRAVKELKSLPTDIIKNLTKKITSLKENPLPRGSIKLSGSQFLYRLRFGDYRVIYLIDKDDKLITIQYIRHRKDVYRFLK